MPRRNAIYIETLNDCVLRALDYYDLPAMIATSQLLKDVIPLWDQTPLSRAVELNAVIVGKTMGRLGYAQIHGPMFNGWWVEK